MTGKKNKIKKKKGNQSKQNCSTPTVDVSKLDGSASATEEIGVSESDVEHDRCINLEEKCASLEGKIELLQNEVNSCIDKEAIFEERLTTMEEMNRSFVLEKSSIKEGVFRLHADNEGLQMQVKELKIYSGSLAQESKQLAETISILQLQIQHLEMVSFSKINGEEKQQLEVNDRSVKPGILNEDQLEKASETHSDPFHFTDTAENPTNENSINSTIISDTSADYTPKVQEIVLKSNEMIETIAKDDESCYINSIEDLGSGVVSVPLELQPAEGTIDAEVSVPISDAPLIGAPFRLISFVSRFVSGADLVDRDSRKPVR